LISTPLGCRPRLRFIVDLPHFLLQRDGSGEPVRVSGQGRKVQVSALPQVRLPAARRFCSPLRPSNGRTFHPTSGWPVWRRRSVWNVDVDRLLVLQRHSRLRLLPRLKPGRNMSSVAPIGSSLKATDAIYRISVPVDFVSGYFFDSPDLRPRISKFATRLALTKRTRHCRLLIFGSSS
jgi:hypothetical protein